MSASPIDWSRLNWGVCPRCREDKFIGHGPLCLDCYLGGPPPLADACLSPCGDPFPGESAWFCERPASHNGPHKQGNVAWSSGGSQVGDHKHDDEGGDW